MVKIDPNKLARELEDILIHRECVQRSGKYLAEYLKSQSRGADSTALILRCQLHDISKMQNLDEFMALASIVDEMSEMHDVTHTLSDRQRDAISLHWANNSHHPEHFESPNDMSKLDLMEMACDCHARSKQFGNPNVIDYLVTQQDERFHFDKDHFERLCTYGRLLDMLTLDDDYSDILSKNYDLGFNFTDSTVANLENFDIDCFPEYLYTDRLYLRRNNDTDFATISYEVHLKDINTAIGFVNVRYTSEIEYKIYERYLENGYGAESIKKIIETSPMTSFYIKVSKESPKKIEFVKSLGFEENEIKENTIKFIYQKKLDKPKMLIHTINPNK